MNYRKIKDKIEFEGIGIHTGKQHKVVLLPAKTNSGINFFVNNIKIPSKIDYVVNTTNATVLGLNDIKISTVEHLLSAIYSLYITDLNIYVDGEEIPIYDGSAKFFVEKIFSVGLEETNPIQRLDFKQYFKFTINNTKYEVYPSEKFEIYCELYYEESPLLNGQKLTIEFSPEIYVKEISYAKTYCFLKDVQKLQTSGYGLGGNTNNVIVIDGDKILNPDILTYDKDEFVRHKILDFIGDFSLLGVYLNAKIKIVNPCHYTNFQFCKQLKEFLNSYL